MHTKYESLPMDLLPIRINKFVKHKSEDHIHWHEEIEILYFVEGEGRVICDLCEHAVRSGDIVISNSKEMHTGCLYSTDTVYYCIQLNTSFFHNLIGEQYVVFQNIITDGTCRRILDEVIENMRCDSFEHIVAAKRLMYEFFGLICGKYTKSVLPLDEYKRQFFRLDTFNSAIDYIERHYADDLSVDTLAKQFFVSPSYFSHLFKKHSGKSVMDYVCGVRIGRAKMYLESENISIGEIAASVGFSDINYFSRKFKQQTAVTPSEYRRKCSK